MAQLCWISAVASKHPSCKAQKHNEPTKGVEDLVEVVEGAAALNEELDALVGSADGLGNLIDVLGLDNSLQVILEELGEVVCKRVNPLISFQQRPLSLSLLCNSEPRKYLMTSSQSGGLSYLPKLGLSFPERILSAVDLPIPLVPTRPKTLPGRGMGRRWSLNELAA